MCFWFEGSMQKKRDGEKCTVRGEADALKKVGLKISPPKSGLSSGWYAKARGSHVACLDLVTCKPGEKTAAWKKLSSWQLGNSATQENVTLGTQESTLERLCSQAHQPSIFHWISFVSWRHDNMITCMVRQHLTQQCNELGQIVRAKYFEQHMVGQLWCTCMEASMTTRSLRTIFIYTITNCDRLSVRKVIWVCMWPLTMNYCSVFMFLMYFYALLCRFNFLCIFMHFYAV